MAEGNKVFTFFELAKHDNGKYVMKEDCISEYQRIRGLAARGTLDSQPAWLLEQTIMIGGTVVEVTYADNAEFTQVWDDRTTVFPPAGSGGATNLCIPAFRILDSDGNPITPANPLDVSGSFSQSGLSTDLAVTKQTITDTAAAIPTTALTDRNSMIIKNCDVANSVFIGKSTVTASGANEGWEIEPDSFYSLDITDGITLYAICDTALTADIKILELA